MTGAINEPITGSDPAVTSVTVPSAAAAITDGLLRHVLDDIHSQNETLHELGESLLLLADQLEDHETALAGHLNLLTEIRTAAVKALEVSAAGHHATGQQLTGLTGQLAEVLQLARKAAPLIESAPAKWALRRAKGLPHG